MTSLKPRLQAWAARRYGPEKMERFDELYSSVQSRIANYLDGWSSSPAVLVQQMVGELGRRRYLLEIRQNTGPAGLRARVDTRQLHLILFYPTVVELEQRLGEERHWALALLLGHEFYHVLDPECPALLAEICAYAWCGQVTGHFLPL